MLQAQALTVELPPGELVPAGHARQVAADVKYLIITIPEPPEPETAFGDPIVLPVPPPPPPVPAPTFPAVGVPSPSRSPF
jgi:hypothetical protein